LRIKESSYGPDHPEVASTLTNLGIVAREPGYQAGVRKHIKRALGTFREVFGDEHPNTLTAHNLLQGIEETIRWDGPEQ